MMKMKIALVGISGYGGMVLYQMLQHHSQVTQIELYGHQQTVPTPLSQVVPLFIGDHTHQVLPYDSSQIMAHNDAVFFATSAGVTSQLAAPFIAHHFPVIDLSGDYRLKQPATYEKWYHKPAAKLADLQMAHYGLAEFNDARHQSYIANPGCYATATLLGLAPLIQDHLVDVDSIIVDAKSGTSGAGKTPSAMAHFTQVNDNLQLYKVNEHKHIPEIVQQLQQWDSTVSAIQFSTTLLPITRGILATIYVKATPTTTAAMVDHAFQTTYANQPFVRYTGQQMPTIKQVVGTDYCDLGVMYNEATHTIMVASVIDNLVKGAGGQAIQNFNQMNGFDEADGLPTDVLLP